MTIRWGLDSSQLDGRVVGVNSRRLVMDKISVAAFRVTKRWDHMQIK